MNTRSLILVGIISLACRPSDAATWYYVGSSNDWWNAASYSKTEAPSGNTQMPGAGDLIYPQSGQELFMDDSTVAFLNTVDGFYFPFDFNRSGASLYLNLTTNVTVTCCLGDVGGHHFYRNWLIKDGAGELYLDGRAGVDPNRGIAGSGNEKSSYRYAIGFDVRDGGVHLEPRRADVTQSAHGGVKVAAGAVFHTASGAGQRAYFYGCLEGAGTFASDNEGDAYPVYFRGDYKDPGVDPPTVFSGRLTGKMEVVIRHSTDLTGVSNDVSGLSGAGYFEGNVNMGVIGVRTWAGSFAGQSLSLATDDGGMCLRFLNDADESVSLPSGISFKKPGVMAIDAGVRGGVTVSSANWWGLCNSSTSQGIFILSGSNTVTSAFHGPMENDNRSAVRPSFFIKKQGTGTWLFDPDTKVQGMQYNGISAIHGVFAVDEGTLEVPSLAEAGQRCSLGYSDWLFEDRVAPTNELARVPYAIRLGTPTTGEGALSYVGTAAQAITTRPIAVRGRGRLRAPNAPYLNWAGVTGLNGGVENVMTFECAAGQTNVVTDVSGNLSVVKDGPGELVLKDDIAFTGGLVVKQGTATFANFNNAPYEWFKVTVKETAASSTNELYKDLKITTGTSWSGRYSRRFEIEEFGLYDAQGARVNAYQDSWTGTETTPDWTVETLQPGQIAGAPTGLVTAFQNGFSAYAWYAADNVATYGGTIAYRGASYHWNDGDKYAQYDHPETWMSLVQRLKGEDVGKVSSLDVCINAMKMWTPTALEVFGSADGEHWDSLFATNNIEIAKDRVWLSGSTAVDAFHPEKTAHPKFTMSRTTQKPIFDFAAPGSVSVAHGATLRLVGAPLAVSKLVVNTAGIGTLEGPFAFAPGGTLEVSDLPDEARVEISGTYVGCTGLDNLSGWSVTSGGRAVRRALTFVDGKFVITKPGLAIILR